MSLQPGSNPNRPERPRQAPPRPEQDRSTPPSPRGDGSGTPPRRTRPPKEGDGRGVVIASALLRALITLGVCVFLAIFVLRSASDLFGLNQIDRDYEVVIPNGADLKQITAILGEKSIVDQTLTFRLYASFKLKEEDVLKPGTYTLNSDMAYDQILNQLKRGDYVQKIVSLTFYEGRSLDEIAQILEANKVCKAEDFLNYLQTTPFMDYDFINEVPPNENLYMRMEGYVFPDTYEFYVEEKLGDIAAKFLNNFNRRMTPELLARMEIVDMSIHEVLTLASIIEKEAGDPGQMKLVSSVFHNRLDNKANFPKLQSDVTIFYVEEHIKNKLRPFPVKDNQEQYDAYNTYVCDGLPPGPIANPGEEAIRAALYPEPTNYYYFVTDLDGKYYYASTLTKHNENIATAESKDETGAGKIGGGIMTHDGTDTRK